MAMSTVQDPEIQTQEVYRNSPFEHITTADAGQIIVTCSTPIHVAQGWMTKAGSVRVGTTLPSWMGMQGIPASPSPPVESIAEKLDWISNLLSQVQFEILEDAVDVGAARKALADPRNAVRVPLDEVKARLGL